MGDGPARQMGPGRAAHPSALMDASQVLAVLVAHNGEQWLPRTLVDWPALRSVPPAGRGGRRIH